MKALILFDGSSTSFNLLKTACEDAAALYAAQPGQEYLSKPTEALLLLIKFTSNFGTAGYEPSGYGPFVVKKHDQHDPARDLLEQGVRRLECSGEFDKVSGEIIVCAADNLTNVVQDRAKEWKATNLYVALDPSTTLGTARPHTERGGWLSWFGFKKSTKAAEIPSFEPQTPLTTAQVRVKQLLENARCHIVVVNSEGLAMRMSYYLPTRPAIVNPLPARYEVRHIA